MLDLKEEQKYERLRKLGQELHIPTFEAFLTLEVLNKDGKLIQKHHQRSHSWVRNAYNMLFSAIAAVNGDDDTFGAGKLNIKDTLGTVQYAVQPIAHWYTQDIEGTTYGFRAPAGESAWGIQVGSGTNTESFEDYVLQTQIAEGAGAGQLNHAASEAHAVSYAALVFTNVLIRYFNNNSGGSIDVNEVALAVKAMAGGGAHQWLQSRDHLASTVTVPDTGQLKVTYTIQLTYPS